MGQRGRPLERPRFKTRVGGGPSWEAPVEDHPKLGPSSFIRYASVPDNGGVTFSNVEDESRHRV